jgi:hypothetical protein
MHIPGWDPAFLSRYDPGCIATAARETGADGVMLYFQSHMGLCYWPTTTGRPHPAMAKRDFAGEALAALRADGLPVCAYYSANFNNQAWLDHPEWRLEPSNTANIGILPRERYGIVCMNAAGYRAFVRSQIAEICQYDVSAFFFDMMWWNGVCRCSHCAARYRAETGLPLPESVDWHDPAWTRFQAAREAWLADWAITLRRWVKDLRPELDVYHNFALGLANWTRAMSVASVAGHDFLGGDFYGGRAEQLLVTRLMLNLTPGAPAEFMTTATTSLIEHHHLRPQAELDTKAMATAASGAAFLAIGAIDPDGALAPGQVQAIAHAFDAARPFQLPQSARPIEDFGLYFSDQSRMNVMADARSVTDAPPSSQPDYPHFHAIAGACRALQRAHLPFGVLSVANLHELARWPVIVLANAARMSSAECDAFRAYVAQGGRLYASRHSSLTDPEGDKRADFGLGDLFGCHYLGEETGRLIYLTDPEEAVDAGSVIAHWRDAGGNRGATRIAAEAGGVTVALRGLPYGYPAPGRAEDQSWASIHASPLWERTHEPVIVSRTYGLGRVTYSAADVEAGGTPEHEALLVAMLKDLLPEQPRFQIDTHPGVWVLGFEVPQEQAIVITCLSYPAEFPALPVPSTQIRLRVPEGKACHVVTALPRGEKIAFDHDASGLLVFETGTIAPCAQYRIALCPA